MDNSQEYKRINVWPSTAKRLRLLSILTGRPLVELMDELTERALVPYRDQVDELLKSEGDSHAS